MTKKIAITLDTNILVNYLEESNLDKFGEFYKFITLFNSPYIDIYLVDLVVNEWNDVKLSKFQKTQKSIKDRLKSFEKFLNNADVQSLNDYAEKGLELIHRYENKYYTVARKRIYDIDQATERSKIIEYSNLLVLKKMTELILNFQEPFFNKGLNKEKIKIEAEDAAIFLSVYYHFKTSSIQYKNIYFVTLNKDDFSNVNNPYEPHNFIKYYFDEVNIEYVYRLENLFHKIQSIHPPFINLENDIDMSNQSNFQYLGEEYFRECPNCNYKFHVYSNPTITRYGHIFYICMHCNEDIDSGESLGDFHQ